MVWDRCRERSGSDGSVSSGRLRASQYPMARLTWTTFKRYEAGDEVGFLGGEQLRRLVIQPGDDGFDLASGQRAVGIGLGAHRERAQPHGQAAQPLGRPAGHPGLGPQPRHHRHRGVATPAAPGFEGRRGLGDPSVELVPQGDRRHQIVAAGPMSSPSIASARSSSTF